MKPSNTFVPNRFEADALAPRLHALVEAGGIEAARHRCSFLVSMTFECPPVLSLSIFRQAQPPRLLWHQPDEGMAMAGVGFAVSLVGSGEDRFTQVNTAYRRLVSEAQIDTCPSYPLSAPVALGGFAFDPSAPANPVWEAYPDALLIVPRFFFMSAEHAGWCTINLQVSAGCDPDAVTDDIVCEFAALMPVDTDPVADRQPAMWAPMNDPFGAWEQQVHDIVQAIQRGAVQKVVLARELQLRAQADFDVDIALRRLAAADRHCTLFALDTGSGCMIGATPERLVRLQGRTVQVDCLAGSTARGDTEHADRRLGEALLHSDKDRREHGLVVRTLREALSSYCLSLQVPDAPRLLRLPEVQHLHTPLQGTLPAGSSILDLVAQLHPTPGVGGVPRPEALDLIREQERLGRGWYAGPIGWIDAHGGEFVVGIRSALVRGSEAWLYAGCGIVKGSDPRSEYEESCLKLRPMLAALSETAS
jgi:isochorismate synthase